MPKRQYDNPWGLSPQQAATMDAMAELGCYKRVAKHLGISQKTAEVHINVAAEKMAWKQPELDNRIRRILAWDRWRRQAEGQAA